MTSLHILLGSINIKQLIMGIIIWILNTAWLWDVYYVIHLNSRITTKYNFETQQCTTKEHTMGRFDTLDP